jgi:DNA phosphorothioation-associated DGQHR protein 1
MEYIEGALEFPALEVKQGFGVFYACSISVRILLNICDSIKLEALDEYIDNDPLDLTLRKNYGTQREIVANRSVQIKKYIETGVSAFPNSIILGANIGQDGYLLEKNQWGWNFENNKIIVNNGAIKASIIDGQHRLSGFRLLKHNDPMLDTFLLCSIYLDIPISYHAQIFSIINSTQRKVNKNLIYQLYQIDLDTKNPQFWSPDVLCVYMARGLASDDGSSLKNKIILAVQDEEGEGLLKNTKISLASVVESIMKFISSKPAEDRERFYSKNMETYQRENLNRDSSIWRDYYLKCNDKLIYNRVLSLVDLFYRDLDESSIYFSSVGFSALFDAYRIFYTKSMCSYEDGFNVFKKAFHAYNINTLDLAKNSASKAKLRDLVLYSIKKGCGDFFPSSINLNEADYEGYVACN